MSKESRNERFYDMAVIFFVSTTCICLLEGIVGVAFLGDQKIEYGAYFSPPLFGLISAVLSGIVVPRKSKNMSFAQLILRQVLLLFLIEISVLGLNYLGGNLFSFELTLVIIIAITVIYGAVYLAQYLNDRQSANEFNQRLKHLQNNHQNFTHS